MNSQPIAVFDSGLGGLSVVRRLRETLPAENLVYFGDTARVPYGTKSRRTVVTFALEVARFLLDFDPKLIVAACNTASALAMDELMHALPLPVIGVVEPGAREAVRVAGAGPVAVLGTEATIQSRSYEFAIRAAAPQVEVIAQACPLFVPLVEEGRESSDPIVKLTAETYLAPLRERHVTAAVLGCTHYPLIRDAIAAALGGVVEVIDSGRATARTVREALAAQNALSEEGQKGSMRCYVSDNEARFQQVGSRFLQEAMPHVELVEPERYISGAHART